jgi:transposase
MPQKKYIVTLTSEERQQLAQISRTGKASAYQITRARILLKADTSQPEENWKDAEISAALDVSVATIERLREQFVEEGVPKCLQRKTRIYERLLDGEQEAKLVAIACSEAPAGRSRWTLRLLSERVVELGYVEQISHETVRQTLKKTNLSLGAKTAG